MPGLTIPMGPLATLWMPQLKFRSTGSTWCQVLTVRVSVSDNERELQNHFSDHGV